ncbi:slipin family protein [Chitinophaga nivalis]|uniref:Slipin family protein n=1 Tax=Chitinophaga nivalis TaxID=2991709 RepID=A0ABT3IUQ5_9BACT|nr:slipin family protein [Chitinophaga nivalis]MCW3462601.1 slipin family protein [Chitinophaga nivalis]MCW3487708.1 slipin family protein [Chitinophaga nivalis]
MKRVTVNAYEAGLVFKNGVYKRMLREGHYWLFGEDIIRYDLNKPFVPNIELNILLQDKDIAAALEVVAVNDDEIVLQYENGLLKNVLTAGRYAYWKNSIAYTFIRADISKIDIREDITPATLSHKLVAPYVRTIRVENYEKAVLLVDGKYAQILSAGVYHWWKNDISISVSKIDTRQLQVEINGQEILTKDKAALRINAWAQYRITDIETAVLHHKDYERQLYVLFQLALREYVAALTFDELLEKKETLAAHILQAVSEHSAAMGVSVTGFGIRDIILPGDIKDIMNQVLVAEKKAQANIIMRREETASTRSLLNTARLMEDNPMLFRLKEMEYVEKIAEKINNISVNGNGVLIDQLKQLFISKS